MPKSFSTPIHPALVHFPITFIFITQLLDLTYTATTHPLTAKYVSTYVPYDLKPHLGDIARLAHLSNFLGVAFAVPTILTGVYELIGLLSRQAVADKLAAAETSAKGKAKAASGLHPKVKLALMHAFWMDVTIGVSGYGWWIRRENALGAPGPVNAGIAAGTLLSSMIGLWAGGWLVYRFGVGVYSTGTLQAKKDI